MVIKFVDHPNVMSIINHFVDNDTAYTVAEYLDGSTLLEYTADQGGTIPYKTAARILMPVMDALREIHESGILHRDISKDDVSIARAGLVQLFDFGAARKAHDLGGTINFKLLHDLEKGMFIRSRRGILEVSSGRVLFRGDDGVRVFNTSWSSIREAKKSPRSPVSSSGHVPRTCCISRSAETTTTWFRRLYPAGKRWI